MNLISKIIGALRGKGLNMGDGFIRDSSPIYALNWSNTEGARGPLYENSIVASCCGWLLTTIPNARLRVMQPKNGEDVIVEKHKLYEIIREPNQTSGYMWSSLVGAIAVSLSLDGNAYLRIRRNNYLQVAELEYIPHMYCSPKRRMDNSGFDVYSVNSIYGFEEVPKAEIIHFRIGIDPENTLKGMALFRSITREVLTDNEASVYNHAILKNLGMMGFLISPAEKDSEFTDEQAKGLENRILRHFTGEDRGKPAVLSNSAKVESIGNTPEKLAVRDMRMTPEERVCSIFGIPPMVLQLGSGLAHSTFSNMKEAREAAYESCNGPLWSIIAESLDAQLLPFIGGTPDQFCYFDTSKVKALQEEEDKKHARARDNFQKGIWKRSEARSYLGRDSTLEDEVYFTDIQSSMAVANAQRADAVAATDRAKFLQSLDHAEP